MLVFFNLTHILIPESRLLYISWGLGCQKFRYFTFPYRNTSFLTEQKTLEDIPRKWKAQV